MKKITIIILAVVVALGGLGIGYAKWSDTVTINGTVNTGTVKVGIRDYMTSDMQNPIDWIVTPDPLWDQHEHPLPASGRLPYVEGERKDVANSVSINNNPIECTCPGWLGNHYASITENVTNAYPFYAPWSIMTFVSCGSIPVKIDQWAVTWTDNDNIFANVRWYWRLTEGTTSETFGTIYGEGLEALGNRILGIQLHNCEFLDLVLQMVFLESTPQGANASFTVSIGASQYNEVPD